MPELPEVETVCRSLRQCVLHRKIVQVQIRMAKIIKQPTVEEFAQKLNGLEIINIRRRGKYILIELEQDLVLVVHLRMTGKLLWQERKEPVGKHTHIILQLDNAWDLRFDDTRQFGAMYLTAKNELALISGLQTLGMEPLDIDFTWEAFLNLTQGKKQKAKVFLLDQRYVAGIGNIYADEILFQAGIHPETLMNTLEEEELQRLWSAIIDRLEQGIKYGGSSIKDYVDSFGNAGTFQEHHKVYGKSGQACVNCGSTIEKIKLGGRSTCFCPNCQIRK